MVKIVIETGSGSHTTSSASCIVKVFSGENKGKMLYTVPGYQVKANWDSTKLHEKWVETEFNLPEGLEIEIIGKGRTGARGADHHDFHSVYKVDTQAEVLDTTIDVGLRDCTIKGRLTLVRDLLAAAKKAAVITDEGF